MSRELNARQNVLLGTVVAIVEGLLVQPTLYWKNARAQGLRFTLDPRILYRGTGAALANEIQSMQLQFAVTGFLQRRGAGGGAAATSSSLLSGDLGGAIAGGMLTALISAPIELVMIQQQLFGGSFFSTPARIIKTHGMGSKGLMRAISVTVVRDAIYVGSMLGVTPLLQNYFEHERKQSTVLASLNASLLGGLLAAVPSHPFDIVKTCMQGDLSRATYGGALSTVSVMYRQGGVSRFFNGCLWRSLNIMATVYIANECKLRLTESFKRL